MQINTYRWYADNKLIGNNSNTYTLTADDINKVLKVKITDKDNNKTYLFTAFDRIQNVAATDIASQLESGKEVTLGPNLNRLTVSHRVYQIAKIEKKKELDKEIFSKNPSIEKLKTDSVTLGLKSITNKTDVICLSASNRAVNLNKYNTKEYLLYVSLDESEFVEFTNLPFGNIQIKNIGEDNLGNLFSIMNIKEIIDSEFKIYKKKG